MSGQQPSPPHHAPTATVIELGHEHQMTSSPDGSSESSDAVTFIVDSDSDAHITIGSSSDDEDHNHDGGPAEDHVDVPCDRVDEKEGLASGEPESSAPVRVDEEDRGKQQGGPLSSANAASLMAALSEADILRPSAHPSRRDTPLVEVTRANDSGVDCSPSHSLRESTSDCLRASSHRVSFSGLPPLHGHTPQASSGKPSPAVSPVAFRKPSPRVNAAVAAQAQSASESDFGFSARRSSSKNLRGSTTASPPSSAVIDGGKRSSDTTMLPPPSAIRATARTPEVATSVSPLPPSRGAAALPCPAIEIQSQTLEGSLSQVALPDDGRGSFLPVLHGGGQLASGRSSGQSSRPPDEEIPAFIGRRSGSVCGSRPPSPVSARRPHSAASSSDLRAAPSSSGEHDPPNKAGTAGQPSSHQGPVSLLRKSSSAPQVPSPIQPSVDVVIHRPVAARSASGVRSTSAVRADEPHSSPHGAKAGGLRLGRRKTEADANPPPHTARVVGIRNSPGLTRSATNAPFAVGTVPLSARLSRGSQPSIEPATKTEPTAAWAATPAVPLNSTLTTASGAVWPRGASPAPAPPEDKDCIMFTNASESPATATAPVPAAAESGAPVKKKGLRFGAKARQEAKDALQAQRHGDKVNDTNDTTPEEPRSNDALTTQRRRGSGLAAAHRTATTSTTTTAALLTAKSAVEGNDASNSASDVSSRRGSGRRWSDGSDVFPEQGLVAVRPAAKAEHKQFVRQLHDESAHRGDAEPSAATGAARHSFLDEQNAVTEEPSTGGYSATASPLGSGEGGDEFTDDCFGPKVRSLVPSTTPSHPTVSSAPPPPAQARSSRSPHPSGVPLAPRSNPSSPGLQGADPGLLPQPPAAGTRRRSFGRNALPPPAAVALSNQQRSEGEEASQEQAGALVHEESSLEARGPTDLNGAHSKERRWSTDNDDDDAAADPMSPLIEKRLREYKCFETPGGAPPVQPTVVSASTTPKAARATEIVVLQSKPSGVKKNGLRFGRRAPAQDPPDDTAPTAPPSVRKRTTAELLAERAGRLSSSSPTDPRPPHHRNSHVQSQPFLTAHSPAPRALGGPDLCTPGAVLDDAQRDVVLKASRAVTPVARGSVTEELLAQITSDAGGARA